MKPRAQALWALRTASDKAALPGQAR